MDQCYLVAVFSEKIYLAKSQNKTQDKKFLAIIEAFKTWRHYL